MLADGQGEAFDKRRLDLPATRSSDLFHRFAGTKDHPVRHPYQATPTQRFDHLRIPQPRQRHPPRLWCGTFGLVALGMDPAATMGQDCGQVGLESITEQEGNTVRGEAPGHLMQHPLGHGQGTGTDIDHQQSCCLGLHSRP